MKKFPCVYITTNEYNTTIYIGVTNNLIRRSWEHKNKISEGFTKQYRLDKLIYYEFIEEMTEAIKREKQLKSWSRSRKNDLINKMNPKQEDLYDTLM